MPMEGVHSYKSRIVAYRNDFCVSCDAPRRTYQVRSFKAYQFYYIPVIPLGFWREWQCSECGRDPHAYPGFPRRVWWVAVLLAGIFAITGVIASFEKRDSIAIAWLMRFAFPAVFFTALWFALRNKPDWALREKLKDVSPDQDTACALCSGALIMDHGWHCSECGARKTAVSQV